MQRISLDEAKERLPDLIDAVIGGEEIFIVGDGGRLCNSCRSRGRGAPAGWERQGVDLDG